MHAIVDLLRMLPDEHLLAVLHEVFTTRQPNPEEQAYNQNCYFLGTASRSRADAPEHAVVWEPWEIQAVAYLDRDTYTATYGPTWGFCQFGVCTACGTTVRSNVKRGICPICGAKVSMT